MNYRETLEYLTTLGKFGIHLGLERIEGILAILAIPNSSSKPSTLQELTVRAVSVNS